MFTVTDEVVVSAAHRLHAYGGEGERLHGHNWRIRATLGAEQLDANGMVVDFADLALALREATDRYRESFLNSVEPFDRINPTAEHLAREVYQRLSDRFRTERVRVEAVEVWESPRSCARYSETRQAE